MRYRVKTYSEEPNGDVLMQTFGVDAVSENQAKELVIRSVELERSWPEDTMHRVISIKVVQSSSGQYY